MGAVGKKRNVQTSKNSGTRKTNDKRSGSQSPKEANKETTHTTYKSLDAQTSKAKSVNPDYTRTTIYLPKKMHKKFKAIAVEEEREMSQIVEELIGAWLETK